MMSSAPPISKVLKFGSDPVLHLWHGDKKMQPVTEEGTFINTALIPDEWVLAQDPTQQPSGNVNARVQIRHLDATVYAVINGRRWKRKRT